MIFLLVVLLSIVLILCLCSLFMWVCEVLIIISGIFWVISFLFSRLLMWLKLINSVWLQILIGICFLFFRIFFSVCLLRVLVLLRYFFSRVNSIGLSIIEMIVLVSIRFCLVCGSRLSVIFRLVRIKVNLLICVRLVVMVSVVCGE